MTDPTPQTPTRDEAVRKTTERLRYTASINARRFDDDHPLVGELREAADLIEALASAPAPASGVEQNEKGPADFSTGPLRDHDPVATAATPVSEDSEPSSYSTTTDRAKPTPVSEAGGEAFQQRVQPWMMACFGAEISADVVERNHRFLEEALELVQSTGCTASEAHQLVDYVFGRDVGETHQEIGGVMVTLAALCLALGENMHAAGETELARIWTKVDKIRAKQAAKPKHSPLPQALAKPASSPDENPTASGETVGSFRDRGPGATNPPDRGGPRHNSTSWEGGE